MLEEIKYRIETMDENLQQAISHLIDYKMATDEVRKINDRLNEEKRDMLDLKRFVIEAKRQIAITQNTNEDIMATNQALKTSLHESAKALEASFQQKVDLLDKPIARYSDQLNQLHQFLKEEVPKSVTVNKRHFIEPKSKMLIASAITVLVISICSLSWAISSQFRIKEMHGDQVKLRMIKLEIPGFYANVDSVYRIDPDRAKRIVEERESLAEELRNAESLHIKKQMEAKLAREKTEKLRKEHP